uniref:C2H2-type domain-containing protein n=2 Tax=Meloidogyne incognita group TaxID=654580 RepID=A0A914L3P9_MELIC
MSEPQLGDSAKENDQEKSADPKNVDKTSSNSPEKQDKEKTVQHKQNRRASEDVRIHSNRQRIYYNQKQFQQPLSVTEKRNDFAAGRMQSQPQGNSNNRGGGRASDKSSRSWQQKTRSLSTNTAPPPTKLEVPGGLNEVLKKDRKDHRHRKSATDIGTSNNSLATNGESFDYEEMDLDEPFSESEDESAARRRAAQKPCLVIPRGRIRSLSGTIPPVGYSPHWGGPTMCLKCLQFFQLPEMMDSFSTHLLNEHKVVIDDMNIIVDLKRYVEHWRQQFNTCKIEDVFPKIIPEEGHPLHGKVDFYYKMTEEVREDYGLRQRLAMRRLEEALACQQREREDHAFMTQCLFCRYIAKGNRAKIIHHLYTIHHLNLGSPDNLVFVIEYIEHLRDKMTRNECIYCEKTFADRITLMDHMRKKNHKEVNPKNNYYDKFYIINYLELGKRWLDVLAEDFEDTMPSFLDSDEEEEDSWEEFEQDNTDEDLLGLCLFCDHANVELDEIVEHMKDDHKFDIFAYIDEQKMELYDRIKFVNFIRKQTYNTRSPTKELKVAEIPEREEWDKDEHLVPMFGNDHLLWMLESWFFAKENESVNEKSAKECNGNELLEGGKSGCKIQLNTLVEESKKNAVSGVIAEDLPDLSESILANPELQDSLR